MLVKRTVVLALGFSVRLDVAVDLVLDVVSVFAGVSTRRPRVVSVLGRSLALWLSGKGIGRSSATGAGAALVFDLGGAFAFTVGVALTFGVDPTFGLAVCSA